MYGGISYDFGVDLNELLRETLTRLKVILDGSRTLIEFLNDQVEIAGVTKSSPTKFNKNPQGLTPNDHCFF